jgi:hypothetical protein
MAKPKAEKKKTLSDLHWQYFLKLESDFYATARHLGRSKINDTACSLEFAGQLICICTECEAVIRKICKTIDPKAPCMNMGNYKRTLLRRFQHIHKAPVRAEAFNRTLIPFAGWQESGGRLDWWNAFQDVKYHIDSNFEKASLIHVMEALGALLILDQYLYAGFSPTGAAELAGTVLLKVPGMPGLEGTSFPKYLPHLPLNEKEPERR